MREQRLAATGSLAVDGGRNGGVRVSGWDQADILLRARVEAWAETDGEARALVSQIGIETGGNRIRAVSPVDSSDHQPWAVSYEIFVPRNFNLSLQTYNGGISVSDVKGRIEFEAHNGGVTLARLSGAVKGATVNGGVNLTLAGASWDGEGLDVQTRNGGVHISVPPNYSAHLEVSTKNGGLHSDFLPPTPTPPTRMSKELSIDLGGGGKTLRVVTTNGGVAIIKQA